MDSVSENRVQQVRTFSEFTVLVPDHTRIEHEAAAGSDSRWAGWDFQKTENVKHELENKCKKKTVAKYIKKIRKNSN